MPKKKTRRGGGSATTATGTADGASSTVSRQAKQRPNDPCACGSGKKYKKCCALKEFFDGSLEGVLARHEAAKRLLDAGDAHGAAKEWANLLEPARLLDNSRAQGAVLNGLGLAYRSLDEHRHAIQCYEEALAINREGSWIDHKVDSDCLVNLGTTYIDLGDYNTAINYLQEGLEVSTRMGDQLGESRALGGLGAAYCSTGDYKNPQNGG